MTDKKMTKREVLNYMLEKYSSDEIVVSYGTHELELLDKKNSSKGATKVQIENGKVMEVIYNELKALDRAVTVSDLMENSEVIKNYALEDGTPLRNQKISALLKKLVESKKVIRTEDKKKAYFSVAE